MAFDEKFYLMFVRGNTQLRQLVTAADVVRATFMEPRILEELARELKISGQEVQSTLSHLATDRADKLSRHSLSLFAAQVWDCCILVLQQSYTSFKNTASDHERVRGKSHPRAWLWWLPRRLQVGSVGTCGTALAQLPRSPKMSHVRTRNSPIHF